MSEAARDFHSVPARVREGSEVVIERDHRPVAVVTEPRVPGRPIAQCIAIANAYEERLGYAPIPDEDFAKDVEAGFEAHREAMDLSAWD